MTVAMAAALIAGSSSLGGRVWVEAGGARCEGCFRAYDGFQHIAGHRSGRVWGVGGLCMGASAGGSRVRVRVRPAWLQLSSRTRGRLVIAVFHGGGCLRRILLDDAPRGEPVRCSRNKADPLLKYLERALAESTAAPPSAKCLIAWHCTHVPAQSKLRCATAAI